MDTSKIDSYVLTGGRDRFWYETAEAVFIDLFGADRLHLVAQLMAATSINTSLKSNVTLFRKALHEYDNGLPIGRYLPNIQVQLKRVRDGLPLSGRKINSFARALSGDPDAVVVDVWLLRAFDEDRKYRRTLSGNLQSGGATDKQYTQIEAWVRDHAAHLSVQPRQLAAMIWAGVRIKVSGDTNTHYTETLRSKIFLPLFPKL